MACHLDRDCDGLPVSISIAIVLSKIMACNRVHCLFIPIALKHSWHRPYIVISIVIAMASNNCMPFDAIKVSRPDPVYSLHCDYEGQKPSPVYACNCMPLRSRLLSQWTWAADGYSLGTEVLYQYNIHTMEMSMNVVWSQCVSAIKLYHLATF